MVDIPEQCLIPLNRIPQALLAAGDALARPELVARGLDCLEWFSGLSAGEDGVVATVGNQWLRKGEAPSGFTGDEQPIDAAALAEACAEAHRVTGEQRWAQGASDALSWFLGRNRLGVVVYDLVTAGCHDGLGRWTANDNQGAESTLAFLQAALAVARTGQAAPAIERGERSDCGDQGASGR